MPRLCPDHGCPLDTRTIHQIEVDICPQCGGIWLDKGEIVRMRKLKAQEIEHFEYKPAPQLPPPTQASVCPICAKPLKAFQYANGAATLSTCAELHGLWVPELELEKIAAMQTPAAQARIVAGMQSAESQARTSRTFRAASFISLLDTQYGWPAYWGLSWFDL